MHDTRTRLAVRRSTRLAATACAVGLAASLTGATPLSGPVAITPESARWATPPGLPGAQSAWMLGAETQPGRYVLRVRLAAGTRIPPHAHPDERYTTVLHGTLYVGFGRAFEERGVVAIPAGAIYVAPAGIPHYVWARDGEVVYQEAGSGPTATVFEPR